MFSVEQSSKHHCQLLMQGHWQHEQASVILSHKYVFYPALTDSNSIVHRASGNCRVGFCCASARGAHGWPSFEGFNARCFHAILMQAFSKKHQTSWNLEGKSGRKTLWKRSRTFKCYRIAKCHCVKCLVNFCGIDNLDALCVSPISPSS